MNDAADILTKDVDSAFGLSFRVTRLTVVVAVLIPLQTTDHERRCGDLVHCGQVGDFVFFTALKLISMA